MNEQHTSTVLTAAIVVMACVGIASPFAMTSCREVTIVFADLERFALDRPRPGPE